MQARKVAIVVSSLTIMLLAAGVAGAIPNRALSSITNQAMPDAVASSAAVSAAVASGITYQGRLTGADGTRLTGSYAMRFLIYDAEVAGSAVWDSGTLDVAVEEGLFTVMLAVDHADFNGQALWLSILVDEQTLSPRQEILPAPYALGLRPGVDVHDSTLNEDDAIMAGYAEATGAAFYGDAVGGAAVVGESANNYGVWGASGASWGGYFTSEDGYGIRVDTAGSDHYDHGAYITSMAGYGLYAQSTQNQGVRAEAGDVTGIPMPLGAVGVAGIGQNRGVYGASQSGIALYGTSDSNYGVWGQSSEGRGVTGRTSRSDNNYGIYTPDNLFAANASVTGAVMQVMQNNGPASIAPGDVVVFSGITHVATLDNAPMAQVSAANVANSAAVAGVVVSRFNIDAIAPALELDNMANDDMVNDNMANQESIAVTPPGDAASGEYVLVVVQGLAQVKVDQVAEEGIIPGALLATSSTRGTAAQAATLSMNGVETTIPGTVFAKALETADGSQEMIYVYVTLQ